MWLIPMYFNIKLSYWRMIIFWCLFSLATGFIVHKATRSPISATTPRFVKLS
jgi:RING finger protein 121